MSARQDDAPRDGYLAAIGDSITAALDYAVKRLTDSVLAMRDDHAKTREELYALSQRVEALERRDRIRRGSHG